MAACSLSSEISSAQTLLEACPRTRPAGAVAHQRMLKFAARRNVTATVDVLIADHALGSLRPERWYDRMAQDGCTPLLTFMVEPASQ